MMSHVSVNFDRSGFYADHNVALPRERLAELAAEGVIGAVSAQHYSFMGATEPDKMEPHARELAGKLLASDVDTVLLVPV
jgi:D-proline reductase (dithiol) PrdB